MRLSLKEHEYRPPSNGDLRALRASRPSVYNKEGMLWVPTVPEDTKNRRDQILQRKGQEVEQGTQPDSDVFLYLVAADISKAGLLAL